MIDRTKQWLAALFTAVLVMAVGVPLAAQDSVAVDTTDVPSDREIRQRLGFAANRIENAIDELVELEQHISIISDGVNLQVIRDSLRPPPAPPETVTVVDTVEVVRVEVDTVEVVRTDTVTVADTVEVVRTDTVTVVDTVTVTVVDSAAVNELQARVDSLEAVVDSLRAAAEDTTATEPPPDTTTQAISWPDSLRAEMVYGGAAIAVVDSIYEGMQRFLDQPWTVDLLPAGFDGALYLRTTYADESATSPDPFLTVTLPDSAALYVVDQRGGPPPGLEADGWIFTGLQFKGERRAWLKQFGPGEVANVPPNAGEPGMWSVFVLPASARSGGLYPGEGISLDVEPDSFVIAGTPCDSCWTWASDSASITYQAQYEGQQGAFVRTVQADSLGFPVQSDTLASWPDCADAGATAGAYLSCTIGVTPGEDFALWPTP